MSATAAAVCGSPSLRVAILQTSAVIAVAVAIVLAVVVAPSHTDGAIGFGTDVGTGHVRAAGDGHEF
ncbi:hypothetical protein [Gordonia liuliyuniae]|uniref:Uncharacterized protein n=1 Tax=Gordonia liuliyuniae TaxID=2911517 RepID=A0ABS9INT3_9ACTN|nr:hypothetical protein [Gordonia liuliyuniae]MCF8587219.1 hypothetical protein [Gordonia liuliyuniae]